jgi:glycosyltransferase involved in cell wall biosynthesis
VDRRRFTAIPVSANPERFKPAPAASSRGPFNVLYYCTFLPLHGAEVVYDAARLLGTEESIRFTIVGEGPVSGKLDRKLESWNLSNVRRVRWIPYEELSRALAGADLCLGGHFSKNPKAQRVVPGKVYQFLAMAKPVILGDGPANRRCFTHLKDAYLCDATSADDLARGIWELSSDRKRLETIGRNGYLLFQDQFHPEVIAEKLKSLLGEPDITPAARGNS